MEAQATSPPKCDDPKSGDGWMTEVHRITEREHQYVREVLGSEFFGSKVTRFSARLERTFADAVGASFAISFCNGTATLHAGLAAFGVGPGDEVIVPPLTMASTTKAVLHAGATPVFADVDPETWCVDPRAVAALITDRTRAVIPVSLYGLPSPGEALMALAEGRNIGIFDDAAQCFLGKENGRVVGAITHLSSFSFQSTKHLTCGEGGIVTTNDEDLALRLRRMSSLGYAALAAEAGGAAIPKDLIQRPDYARHVSLGWNYRMSELGAAVALAQVERMEELVSVRVSHAQAMIDAVAGVEWLRAQAVPTGMQHSYWTVAFALDDEAPVDWEGFRAEFLKRGGKPFFGAWRLTYDEPFMRQVENAVAPPQNWSRGLCPVAEDLQPRLMQFATDAFAGTGLARQPEILAETARSFE